MAYVPQWRAREADILRSAGQVRTNHPAAWEKCRHHGDDGEFIKLTASACNAQVSVQVGLNGKRGSSTDISKDVLAFPNPSGCFDTSGLFSGLELVDIIIRHETPEAALGWIDVTQDTINGGASGRWIKPAPFAAPKITKLGPSLFWAIRGFKDYRAQLDANLRWLKDTMNADYVRVFLCLGGDLFTAPDGTKQDPWRDASLPIAEALTLVPTVTNHIDSFGMKTEWTLIGGLAQIPSVANQEAMVNEFCRLAVPLKDKIQLVEIMNEYNVNGGNTAMLRSLARIVRAQFGTGFHISLSSPGGTHGSTSADLVQEEVRRMYEGLPEANAITPHYSRPGPDPWKPGVFLGSFAPPFKYNNEWRGPGASAGGDISDPSILASDYLLSVRAGEEGYTPHSKPGVWGGHCNPAFAIENVWANWWDVPNAVAIANGFKQIRMGGTSIPDPQPGEPMLQPYPDEPTWWKQYEDKVVGLYKAAGRDTLDPAAFRWFSRPAWDIAAGMTKEAAEEKHLAKLREALGL